MQEMSLQREPAPTDQPPSVIWKPEVTRAFTELCQAEGLNPSRLRKLIDSYIVTKRKPSRQELIDALKHRPRIQERAIVLSSVTKKLNAFIETYIE